MIRKEALQTAADIEARGFKLRPGKIAIIRDDAEEVTAGGIIIVDEAQRKPMSGTVVMVGDLTSVGSISLSDWVTVSKYFGVTHRIRTGDGFDLEVEIIHEDDVYIVWRSPDGELDVVTSNIREVANDDA